MIPALIAILAIILESWSSLWKSFNLFLNSQQLTVGAILTAMVPFFVIWNKISKEKEKRAQAKKIERRQLQIAFNVNEILEALKVESKWSLQEIGSNHEEALSLKRWFSYVPKVTIQRRKKLMDKLKSRKFWLTILAALIPVLNEEFNISLDLPTLIAIMGAIMSGVALIAHVDAKKLLPNVTNIIQQVAPAVERVLIDPNTKYQDVFPQVKEVHAGLKQLYSDIQLNDGSKAFLDAVRVYNELHAAFEAAKPAAEIPEVSA